MKKPIMLITADLHLRRTDQIWRKRPRIVGDAEHALNQILKVAVDYKVPSISLLGDLFQHPTQHSVAVRLIREFLDIIQSELRCPVNYIQGQHERAEPTWLESLHSWPSYIHKNAFSIGEVNFYGLDYQNPSNVKEALQNVPPKVDVLLTHQVWKDFMGEQRGDARVDWLPEDTAKYVITGDYHFARTLSLDNRRFVLSPGPPYLQAINEEPDKSVIILYDDLSYKRAALTCRKVYKYALETLDDLDQLCSREALQAAFVPQSDVPECISSNILQVTFPSDMPDAEERLNALEGAYLHVFLNPTTPDKAPIHVAASARQGAVAGGFDAVIRTFYNEDPVVRDTALQLWGVAERGGDIDLEINAIFSELTKFCGGCKSATR